MGSADAALPATTWEHSRLAGRFNGAAVVFVFKILHTLDRILFRAGKERRGLAELCARLQSAPCDFGQKCVLCRVGDLALPKLPPDLGGRHPAGWGKPAP